MTNEEFKVFANRLFVSFPAVNEWLQTASPDPTATQVVWRKCLSPYRLDECLGVLDRWSDGRLEPFKAYERDALHLHVRAVIERDRSIARKKQDSREQIEIGTRTAMDVPGVYEAFLAGRQIKRDVMDGKISELESRVRLRELVEAIE